MFAIPKKKKLHKHTRGRGPESGQCRKHEHIFFSKEAINHEETVMKGRREKRVQQNYCETRWQQFIYHTKSAMLQTVQREDLG